MDKAHVVEWKDSHWCTAELDTATGERCFSRNIAVDKRQELFVALCCNCGSVRRVFHSENQMESHIRLHRLNVHRPQHSGHLQGHKTSPTLNPCQREASPNATSTGPHHP